MITYKCDRCLKEIDKETDINIIDIVFPIGNGLNIGDDKDIITMHFCLDCFNYVYKHIRVLLREWIN